MNEKLYESLEICLNALETGTDLESILKRFPGMRDDLLPLLETSQQARSLAIQSVPENVYRRGKARVLQHAAGLRELEHKTRKNRPVFSFPRLAMSLAIALIFLLSGTELVRASSGALPGDQLYPVKRTWEDVRLLLVLNPASREELEDEFEVERLHEVGALLAEGRHESISFAGVVTEQSGNLWVVSGVSVEITPDSQLPETPVTLGTSIKLQGHTNAQGFVEAERVEILGSGILLPVIVPTRAENNNEDAPDHENPNTETNDNSGQENNNQDEDTLKPPSNEDHGDSDSEDTRDSINSDSNSNENYTSNEDHSDKDQSGSSSDDEIRNDSSDSGGGSNENNIETHD